MVGKINVNVDKIVNHKHKTEREHMNDASLIYYSCKRECGEFGHCQKIERGTRKHEG